MRALVPRSKALNTLLDIADNSRHREAAENLRERLESLLRESDTDLAPQDIIRTVMGWAVEQSYAMGGYPQVRALMLDTLEEVMLRDAMKERAA